MVFFKRSQYLRLVSVFEAILVIGPFMTGILKEPSPNLAPRNMSNLSLFAFHNEALTWFFLMNTHRRCRGTRTGACCQEICWATKCKRYFSLIVEWKVICINREFSSSGDHLAELHNLQVRFELWSLEIKVLWTGWFWLVHWFMVNLPCWQLFWAAFESSFPTSFFSKGYLVPFQVLSSFLHFTSNCFVLDL